MELFQFTTSFRKFLPRLFQKKSFQVIQILPISREKLTNETNMISSTSTAPLRNSKLMKASLSSRKDVQNDSIQDKYPNLITTKLKMSSTSLSSTTSANIKPDQPRRFELFTNGVTNAVGPASLLGGTALVYSSILRHSSCTLNPLSTFYMFLLAIQYCVQPRITKKYLDKRVNKKSVAMVEEVVKMSMAAGFFCSSSLSGIKGGGNDIITGAAVSGFAAIRESLKDWTLTSSLTVAALPAFLYAIQGVLTYTAYQKLDSVTFNGLSQTKTISAAICCFFVMGKKQSLVQVGALGLLFVSALIFQGELQTILDLKDKWWNKITGSKKNHEVKHEKMEKEIVVGTEKKNDSSRRLALGILPCLGATFLSGLAGAFSQKGLQLAGGKGRNPFLYTVEISFFSAFCLFIPMILHSFRGHRTQLNNTQKQTSTPSDTTKSPEPNGYFAYWSMQTFIPIIVKAFGGILTALVHKHAGSVVKGFALILGLVFSGTAQSLMDNEQLRVDQVLGTALVMVSSWLHFTNPPV